jgi:cytochrome c biogenesis protein CcmG/thiol:disulfide interchange protein DsbE
MVIAAMFTGFGYQLLSGKDASLVPSALIGRAGAGRDVAAPEGNEKPASAPNDFGGEPILVNVFASWCVPCRAEHPLITALAREPRTSPSMGLNSKDTRAAAIRWLDGAGRSLRQDRLRSDGSRRASNGAFMGIRRPSSSARTDAMVFKHVGPISPRLIDNEILPRIAAFRDE